MTPSLANSHRKRSFRPLCFPPKLGWGVILSGVAISLLVGCGGKSSESVSRIESIPQRPLRAMESAVRRGQWQEAWGLSDAVLESHPDDAEAIATVARVAHENGKPDVAAELLVRACRAESFRNASRVQQAMIAMIRVGKLHEGMEMLEEAIGQQPEQHETRRWLFDFYVGTENRNAAVPHGRFLVRQRRFDLELLLSLGNTGRRSLDDKPLEEMIARNPDDKRPLLGSAKRDFDQRAYEQSITTLRSIIQAHDDYLPARALLGRVLAASGNYEALEKWASEQPESIGAYTDYWTAVGDWARSKQQFAAAARAYWEATRIDADVMECWSKLSMTLPQAKVDQAEIPRETLERVDCARICSARWTSARAVSSDRVGSRGQWRSISWKRFATWGVFGKLKLGHRSR